MVRRLIEIRKDLQELGELKTRLHDELADAIHVERKKFRLMVEHLAKKKGFKSLDEALQITSPENEADDELLNR